MIPAYLSNFKEIWLIDFEFHAPDGERPEPICLVAQEIRSGHTHRLWEDELHQLRVAPYPTGKSSLVVAFYASAEMGCHLALQWPMPVNVLDLYVEHRVRTNGLSTICGNGLIGAMAAYGLNGIDAIEKDVMRDLAIRGGPWTPEERQALLKYCERDVIALGKLLPAMAPRLDIPHALLRGRYMRAAACIEWHGTPIDVENLQRLRNHWGDIQEALIARVGSNYGVYDGTTFKLDRWEQWLVAHNIPWPRTLTGRLSTGDDVFKDMARAYPAIAPLRELRISISQMRLEQLTVGTDGRNRTLLSTFRSKTGRNQPSNTKSIFGPAVWLRSLIRAQPGWGVAYIDWGQQEFGIAAALSGDPAMIEAYQSGDPYLAFAKQAGAVPAWSTKATHEDIRERFKACVLAVQYGMGADSLAVRINQAPIEARLLLQNHHDAYPTFWRWSDSAVDHAMLFNQLHTVFGWPIHVGSGNSGTNPRSLRNFPMQANGAEMLRLACCLATERGIRVCLPVHDALLIEAPIEELDHAVATTQRAMADASAAVLDGFKLRSDVQIFKAPERYRDKRGGKMWALVQDLVGEIASCRNALVR